MTAPAAMPGEEEVARLLRDTIKVDASGLAPAVVSHYIDGFDAAARAILALFAPILAEKERAEANFKTIAQENQDLIDKLDAAEAALAAERERCAKIADKEAAECGPTYGNGFPQFTAENIAAAIRAGE